MAALRWASSASEYMMETWVPMTSSPRIADACERGSKRSASNPCSSRRVVRERGRSATDAAEARSSHACSAGGPNVRSLHCIHSAWIAASAERGSDGRPGCSGWIGAALGISASAAFSSRSVLVASPLQDISARARPRQTKRGGLDPIAERIGNIYSTFRVRASDDVQWVAAKMAMESW